MKKTLIAVALLGAAAPANAQLQNASNVNAQMMRTNAVLEWTTETKVTGFKSSVKKKDGQYLMSTEETQKETGSVTMVLEMIPEQLPGGVTSRVLNGRPHMVGWIAPNSLPAAQSRLVSLRGSSTITGTMAEGGRCRTIREGEMAGTIDPASATLRGTLNYTQQNGFLTVAFRDTIPIGFSFGTTDSLRRTAALTYDCGGTGSDRPSAVEGNELGVSASADGGWRVQTRRAGASWVMTAEKTESVSGGGTIKRTAKLTWTQPRATSPPQPPVTPPTPSLQNARGTITFTQGGQDRTWPLSSKMDQGAAGMTTRVLLFTVDGLAPDGTKGTVALSYMSMNGRPQLAALSVTAGPRGNSEYDMSTNRCTLRLLTDGGEGTCTGGFNGAVVSRFSFKVQP